MIKNEKTYKRNIDEKMKNMRNHIRNNIRTHQEGPELVQEAPESVHDLAEPLLKPFRQDLVSPTRRARAEGHEPRTTNRRKIPSDRITHTGAIQISRFGLTPQPPILAIFGVGG